jgi:two-component system OmpR family response regulator
VLVVEDELRMAALLKRGLEEDGYAVDVANTGPDALWQATEFTYDALVLDVMLPGVGGIEVCRRLREQGHWVPVLMLTARDTVEDRVRGLDVGADDYLTKPFSFAELSARVRALIRRGGGDRPATVVVGDLRLDPATRRAWRGDTELTLSVKEFALLELFLRHPGEVLTRTRIQEHVWDFASDRVSNVIDQYVLYLRRKIDRPFGVEQLETVRGVGYRLRAPTVSPAGRRVGGN